MSIDALIASYGLPAIFLGAGIEGETTVIAGGILARRGDFAPGWVAAAAGAGSFVADQALFAIGRHFHEHPRVEAMLERPLARKAVASLERHPVLYVMGFRFMIGLRTISPIAIGASGLSRRLFLSLNFVSAAIWAALFTVIGYWLGGRIEPLLKALKSDSAAMLGLVGLAMVLVALKIGWHRFQARPRG